MPKGSWKQLQDQLIGVQREGVPLLDADRSPIRDAVFPTVAFKTYPFARGRVIPRVRAWLRDAEVMLLDAGRQADVQRLDRIVLEFTGLTLARLSSLRLGDFAGAARDEDNDPASFDPLDARMGFHLFLCALTDEARYYVQGSRVAARRLPSLDEKFWTREQLADFRGVAPQSISKEVSEYRRAHGRDPQWVQRLPGKQRGFKIKADVYMAMMPRGGAPAPRRY